MGVILFNGRSCKDFCMTVESRPPAVFPVRRGEVYEIEGSNGSHVQEEDTFSNYVQPYKVWLGGRSAPLDARTLSRGIAAWLLGSSDYCRLEDSYEPERFRLARFAGPLNVEQLLQNFGRCTLEFDVRPERYLKDGENAVTSNGQGFRIVNPTGFKALPIISVTGSGDVEIVVKRFADSEDAAGSVVSSIALGMGSSPKTVVLDCAAHTAKANGIDVDDGVTFSGPQYATFPKLKAGEFYIGPPTDSTFTGTITKIEVIPRWWTP